MMVDVVKVVVVLYLEVEEEADQPVSPGSTRSGRVARYRDTGEHVCAVQCRKVVCSAVLCSDVRCSAGQ